MDQILQILKGVKHVSKLIIKNRKPGANYTVIPHLHANFQPLNYEALARAPSTEKNIKAVISILGHYTKV